MKETLIKFTPAMVEAIRDGRKTQTRRMVGARLDCPYGGTGDLLVVHVTRGICPNITLEIVSVRVEKLSEISHEDCMAEGIRYDSEELSYYVDGDGPILPWMEATGAFRQLWESIYGTRSWDLNPDVWVIQFRRVQ